MNVPLFLLASHAFFFAGDAPANAPMQQPKADSPAAEAKPSRQSDSARKRWERLSPEEKKELAKRFDRWKKLDEPARKQLRDRTSRLTKEVEEIEATLGEEERAALERLPMRERRRILRDLVADQARQMTSRVRSRLTAEEAKSLEKATPEERAKLIKSVRERELASMPERFRRLGDELGLSGQDLKRIESGDRGSQLAAIASVVRRRAERQAKDGMLPKSVPPERWERLRKLDDHAFLRAMQRIRYRDPEFGIPKKRWEGRVRRNEGLANRLEALAHPSLGERAKAPGMRGQRLRSRTIRQRRGRIEEVMISQVKLSLDHAARLRSLDDKDFAQAYRFVIRSLREGIDVGPAFERWLTRRRESGDK